jgi:hypothetical protein
VDPISARAALRLDPGLPLTPDLVEHAFQQELWARHPSRYPDAEGRAAAEAWAGTLAVARATLLAEARTHAPYPAVPARRRLSGGAIAAIVTSGVAVTLVVVSLGIWLFSGLQSVAADMVEQAQQQATAVDTDAVDRYQAGETGYTFNAALEIYSDARFWRECPDGYTDGCWSMAVFTDADCAHMEVVLEFNSDEAAWEAEATDTMFIDDVVAYEPTHVVFGNDDYPYGWIADLICHDGTGV